MYVCMYVCMYACMYNYKNQTKHGSRLILHVCLCS